jgi:hypothetical protein
MIFGEPPGGERLRKPCGDLLYRESVSPCLKRILCGERSENQKPRRFCGENPKRKTTNSIQLRLTIHPSHTGVKGDRTACRGRLNPDFREARNFILLRAERVGKWGLSGLPLPVCPRQCPVSLIPPKPASRATKRSWRTSPPSVATGWRPVGSEGAPKCAGRGDYRGEIRRIFVRSDSARRPPSDGRGAPGSIAGTYPPRRGPWARRRRPVRSSGRPVGRRPVLGQLLLGLATDDDGIGGAQLLQPVYPSPTLGIESALEPVHGAIRRHLR